MNHKLFLCTLLFGISSLATADDIAPFNACELLQAEDLTALGYSAKNSTSSSGPFNMVDNGPENGYSDQCFTHSKDDGRQGDIIVTVERFSKDVSADDVAAWLKIRAARPKDEDVKSEEVQIGDATCEFGTYSRYTHDNPAGIEHFVACDKVSGSSHLAINVQQHQAAKLPTPSEVKKLLDLTVAHLTPAPM